MKTKVNVGINFQTPFARGRLISILLIQVLILLFSDQVRAGEKNIRLEVFFNDLVPAISAEKRHSFETDRDFFHNEIREKLIEGIDHSEFQATIPENSVLILTGRIYSYEKGAISSEVVYQLYFVSVRDGSLAEPDRVFTMVFVKAGWTEGTPLNEVLKPKIRKAVDLIIKEITTNRSGKMEIDPDQARSKKERIP